MPRRAPPALLAALLSGPVAAQQPIVVLGDSVMAWNEEIGRSIPDVLGRTLGREVEALAVPGARLSHATLLGRIAGLDIRGQYPESQPGVVVLTGGANDLGDECDCQACEDTLDTLISSDGESGEIPDFAARMTTRGERIVWLAYYPVSVAGGPFEPCSDALDALQVRLGRMAAQSPQITLVDVAAVWDPADLTLYDPDLIHPSPEGAARIGRLLAETVAALD